MARFIAPAAAWNGKPAQQLHVIAGHAKWPDGGQMTATARNHRSRDTSGVIALNRPEAINALAAA